MRKKFTLDIKKIYYPGVMSGTFLYYKLQARKIDLGNRRKTMFTISEKTNKKQTS